MAKSKENKTNAMRQLEKLNIPYSYRTYECEEFTDAQQIADLLGLDHRQVFKTLVTKGGSGGYFVFVIPIDEELDLKKAARAVSEKAVSMIPVKDILSVTGYIRGGCTAIGMKKNYPARIDTAARAFDTIVVSGGRIGIQIELRPDDLKTAAHAEYADLIRT